MNISVYAPWREYRARIFKIQSRECVSTAWKERAIQRKANSQTPAILNVGPHSAQWRCSSLFKLFHFSSRPFSPSLSYSSTKYSPTWSRNLSAKFHPSLQQRCMSNKHPRLTSQSRIYIPRIPGREESAVEEASVTSSPLTIVVKINSLPLAILPLHRELLSFVFPSSIVTAYSPLARLKISPTLPRSHASCLNENKDSLGEKIKWFVCHSWFGFVPIHCSMHIVLEFTLARNKNLTIRRILSWILEC